MIRKLEVQAIHATVDDKLRRYVQSKIGRLDRYMGRNVQESVHAEVMLKEDHAKDKKQCICEVILHLPHENITVREATINMYAAVDIVEAKLKNQIKRYKELHDYPRLHQRVAARLRRTPVIDLD